GLPPARCRLHAVPGGCRIAERSSVFALGRATLARRSVKARPLPRAFAVLLLAGRAAVPPGCGASGAAGQPAFLYRHALGTFCPRGAPLYSRSGMADGGLLRHFSARDSVLASFQPRERLEPGPVGGALLRHRAAGGNEVRRWPGG